VILMIAGDFLAMSLTTDNVDPSPTPNAWKIGNLTLAGIALGVALLAFCGGGLAIGRYVLHLGIDELRTLTFVLLVMGSQATLYAIRHRRKMWGTRPSLWLIVSSVADIVIALILAAGGIAMAPISAEVAACVLAAAIAFSVALSALKIPICRKLNIA